MAYIYKKTIHGKPYYYLRISTRAKNRIISKDIAYLGNIIEDIAPRIDDLKDRYDTEIRKGYKGIKRFISSNRYLEKARQLKIRTDEYLERENLENVEAIRLHFSDEFLKLDDRTTRESYERFLIDFAFNTTSIEGNTITLKEADKLLRENLTPNQRTPREIFDLQNTQKTFFRLIETMPALSHETIISIHDSLLENMDDRKGYRTQDIRVFMSHFDTTPACYVKTDMDLLLQWHAKHEKTLHPLALAAIFHHKLEKIHPFADGNGRTGRMLLNHILMSKGYPPLIIKKKNRAEYLERLAQADKADINSMEPKHYNWLVNYVAGELIESYWNNFNI